jgi:hypothetical protein
MDITAKTEPMWSRIIGAALTIIVTTIILLRVTPIPTPENVGMSGMNIQTHRQITTKKRIKDISVSGLDK